MAEPTVSQAAEPTLDQVLNAQSDLLEAVRDGLHMLGCMVYVTLTQRNVSKQSMAHDLKAMLDSLKPPPPDPAPAQPESGG